MVIKKNFIQQNLDETIPRKEITDKGAIYNNYYVYKPNFADLN